MYSYQLTTGKYHLSGRVRPDKRGMHDLSGRVRPGKKVGMIA
jgi:hypothetical protein